MIKHRETDIVIDTPFWIHFEMILMKIRVAAPGILYGLILYILSAAYSLYSEPFSPIFEHIGLNHGLSNLSVSSILLDKHGFLWFGTQGGLNRYDGKNFKIYKHRPHNRNSLPHNLVQSLYYDSQDRLWIGTYQGLSRFDPRTETFTNYVYNSEDPYSISNDIVVSIAEDPWGRLWIGTLGGLNRFDEATGRFIRYLPHQEKIAGDLPSKVIRSIFSDSDQQLWVGTTGGLAKYNRDADDFSCYLIDDGLPSPYVMSIAEECPGKLWIGTWGGGVSLFDVHGEDFQTIELEDERVYTINSDHPDLLWVGTWGGGLFCIDKGSREITKYLYQKHETRSLSHDVIYSLYYDNSGILWIGTNGNGINKLSPFRQNHILLTHDPESPNSLSPGKINALFEDSRGDIWIGSYSGGIHRYNPKEESLTRLVGSPSENISAFFEDSAGTLWITSAGGGLSRYHPRDESFTQYLHDPTNPRSISDNITYGISEYPDGVLWIGTYTNGLSRFDIETEEFTHFRHDPEDSNSLSNDLVYVVQRDRQERLWVGTNKGLNLFDPVSGSFTRYLLNPDDPNSISGNVIRSLYIDGKNRLWIGTNGGGLNLFSAEGFKHFTGAHGLSSDSVMGLLEDDHGRIWAATLLGINIIYPDSWSNVVLNEEDGLWDLNLNPGCLRDSKGQLYFSSNNTIGVFNDVNLDRNSHIPPVRITSIKIFNEERDFGMPSYELDRIGIEYSDNFISFEFVALDFVAPDKNEYEYMLKNFDKDWIKSGNRNYANYTNLPPGEYLFQVRGSNNNQAWNLQGASLEVHIAPPIYASWWAILIYVLAGLGILYLGYRAFILHFLEQKMRELESTRGQLQAANAKLEELSIHDSLTGLYNRRKLDQALFSETSHAIKEGIPLAVMMIDIDFFKRYNDYYGHIAGDICLRTIGSALAQGASRSADIVARYGGGSFCVILPSTDKDESHGIAEAIRKKIFDEGIPHDPSKVNGIVTVSIGICSGVPYEGTHPGDLIQAADRALFMAKERGRNRIEWVVL